MDTPRLGTEHDVALGFRPNALLEITMLDLRVLGIRAATASGLPNFFSPSADSRLTTVLFHRFAFAGESWKNAKSRLRRQLEWLNHQYTPVSLSQAVSAFSGATLPRRPVLVTVDDAHIDMLEVAEDFRAFKVPVGLFVCAGWSAQASAMEPQALLARVVSAVEWYEGPDVTLNVGDRPLTLRLSRASRSHCIDSLLNPEHGFSGHLQELAEKIDHLAVCNAPRSTCHWDELIHLQGLGVEIGCHSVSHIRLARASPARLAFEIMEGKRLLQARLGQCSAFAYPYGTADSVSEETTRTLKAAGFQLAFLTHSDFATTESDRYHLPRFPMPDRDMSLAQFRARAMGGAIPFRRAKELFNGWRAKAE